MSDEIMDDQVNEEAVEDTTEDQLKGDERTAKNMM